MTAAKTMDINEYFKSCVDSLTADGLKKATNSGPKPRGDTLDQLNKHEIDVCVVSHRSQNDVMCLNPVIWTPADYWISEIFEKEDMKFKVFLGDC